MSAQSLSVMATDATDSRRAKPKVKRKPKAKSKPVGTAPTLAKAKSRAPKAGKSTRAKAPAKSQIKKPMAKASRKAPAKAKPTRRPAAAVKSKPLSKQAPRNWTAYFVYADATGNAKVAILRIRARNGEKAREIALKAPPGEEFMLTIMPESDEQFLGQVRLKAISAAENRA
jgi:hypothetical protein